MTVCLNLFNQFNHFRNMFCCLTDYIRVTDIQSIDILHKSVCIKTCNLQNRLMALFGRFFHLVLAVITVSGQMSNVCNIHYVLDVISKQSQSLIKNVQEYVSAKVSDMRIIVNCRTAAIKTYMAFCNRMKILHFASHSVIQSQTHFLPLICLL